MDLIGTSFFPHLSTGVSESMSDHTVVSAIVQKQTVLRVDEHELHKLQVC